MQQQEIKSILEDYKKLVLLVESKICIIKGVEPIINIHSCIRHINFYDGNISVTFYAYTNYKPAIFPIEWLSIPDEKLREIVALKEKNKYENVLQN